MAETTEPKRPAAPRAETMQREEVDSRTYYYLPDYDRSVLAHDAREAAELAKKQKEAEDSKVTEDQTNG